MSRNSPARRARPPMPALLTLLSLTCASSQPLLLHRHFLERAFIPVCCKRAYSSADISSHEASQEVFASIVYLTHRGKACKLGSFLSSEKTVRHDRSPPISLPRTTLYITIEWLWQNNSTQWKALISRRTPCWLPAASAQARRYPGIAAQ